MSVSVLETSTPTATLNAPETPAWTFTDLSFKVFSYQLMNDCINTFQKYLRGSEETCEASSPSHGSFSDVVSAPFLDEIGKVVGGIFGKVSR